jgi:hypothetical protein
VPSVLDAQERNNGSDYLLDAVGVSLSDSSFVGAEAAENTFSKYLPPYDGNSETCSVDGIHILTHIVVRCATLTVIPRR